MTPDASAPREALLHDFRLAHGLETLASHRLDLALTHTSYANENDAPGDNERLEFLGDAVLASASSAYLFDLFEHHDEGALSKLRAQVVSRRLMGKRAEEMGLGSLMLLGRSELKAGSRPRRTLLGSALEALVGIIFLDLGYEAAARFVVDRIVEPSLEEIEHNELLGDFKSDLQEWTQSRMGGTPAYRLVEEAGPDHAKFFSVEVLMDGRVLARGEGSRIKLAENEAARLALVILKQEADR
jgi:ribonuclease-3